MFALYTRKRLNVAVIASIAVIMAIIVSTQYARISASTVIVIGVSFITVALVSVFSASRDSVTTMSLLPIWKSGKSDAGTQ
jgi:hypothetical protein